MKPLDDCGKRCYFISQDEKPIISFNVGKFSWIVCYRRQKNRFLIPLGPLDSLTQFNLAIDLLAFVFLVCISVDDGKAVCSRHFVGLVDLKEWNLFKTSELVWPDLIWRPLRESQLKVPKNLTSTLTRSKTLERIENLPETGKSVSRYCSSFHCVLLDVQYGKVYSVWIKFFSQTVKELSSKM